MERGYINKTSSNGPCAFVMQRNLIRRPYQLWNINFVWKQNLASSQCFSTKSIQLQNWNYYLQWYIIIFKICGLVIQFVSSRTQLHVYPSETQTHQSGWRTLCDRDHTSVRCSPALWVSSVLVNIVPSVPSTKGIIPCKQAYYYNHGSRSPPHNSLGE